MATLIKTFAKTVTTAGTRVALSASRLMVPSFVIRANAANTGVIYIGDVTVTSANGMFLAASEANNKFGISVNGGKYREFDLSKVYIDASVNGEGVRVEYLLEE